MQKANVLPPSRPRKTYQVNCYRDGALLIRLQCNSQYDADELSSCWNSGFNQGQMAERMKEKGLKI